MFNEIEEYLVNKKEVVIFFIAFMVICFMSYNVYSKDKYIENMKNSEATQVMNMVEKIRQNKADWSKQEAIKNGCTVAIENATKQQEEDNTSTNAVNEQLIKHGIASVSRNFSE